MTLAALFRRYSLKAFLLGGVFALTGPALAQTAADREAAATTGNQEEQPTVDRGKMRLELLISLVQNELQAATLLKSQLAAETATLTLEQQSLLANRSNARAADQLRLDRIESRLQQVGSEMAVVDAKLPEIGAELDDLQRRLDEANGIVREPEIAEKNDESPAQPSASQWLDGNRRIQEALVYLGGYNALIDGDIGPRTRQAIEVYQERQSARQTGTLTEDEEAVLLERADTLRQQYGMKTLEDSEVGYRVSYPSALLSKVETMAAGHRRMTTADGRGELLITTTDSSNELTSIYDDAIDQYEVQYRRKRNDWFVIAGLGDQGRIIYDTARSTEQGLIRARLSYPAEWRDLWSPFAVIMFNTFEVISPGES